MPDWRQFQGRGCVIYIQKDLCDGCQTCIQVCPYGARTFLENPEPLFGSADGNIAWEEAHGFENFPPMTVDKCNMCKGRRDRGELPACVATCAAGARIFGDLDDENSEISIFLKEHADEVYRLKEELTTEPKVYFRK